MTNDEAARAEGCYFDKASAERAIKFIETYVIPRKVRKVIKLLPWQREIVANLFGWKRADGTPRFRRATISTAKKQGKTVLVSGILAYGLLGGIDASPFVASASTAALNAKQVFLELAYTFRHHPKLKRRGFAEIRPSYREITVPGKEATYRAFSADAAVAEGENLTMAVIDETHAHVSSDLYESLEYSMITNDQGLFINISTAGDDMGHFWYPVFQKALQVQQNEIIDTTLYPFICTVPSNADIDNPANWRKANPSLGVVFPEERFRQDLESAKMGGTGSLLSFKRYRLNMWSQAENSYIDASKFDLCKRPMTDEELKPYPVWIGADLSQTTDPCSLSMVWALPNREFYVRSHAWVCGVGFRKRESSNLKKYGVFKSDGCMTESTGTANDYPAIRRYITDLRGEGFKVQGVIFDQTNAIETMNILIASGIKCQTQPQNHRYFTDPMKQFSIAIDEQRIRHDGKQSWLRWALGNTVVDVDSNGNCRPDRDKSTDKIDATVSTLMAFSQAYLSEVKALKQVYRGSGIL